MTVPVRDDAAQAIANGSDRVPKVSVVISVKNRSAMLFDCLQGLAHQTLARDEFEVIIIDNCSSEDLNPVFDRARRELGLGVIHARTTEDRGPAPARNLGVSLARGHVIAFTDSDCRPSPLWLEAGLRAFAHESVCFVSGPILPKPEQKPAKFGKVSFSETENPTYPTGNLLVLRSSFVEFGGFNAELSFSDPFGRASECADTDLAWRLIESGCGKRFEAESRMFHECEQIGLWMWLLEPTRLFVLPELIRRHPGLRDHLLRAHWFFYPRSHLAELLIAAVVGAWAWQPRLLGALALLLLVRAAFRTGGLAPGPIAEFCKMAPLHLLRMLILNLTLIYGSVRFRCLVL